MKLRDLKKIVAGGTFAGSSYAEAHLPRFLTLAGYPCVRVKYDEDFEGRDVPDDIAAKALEFDAHYRGIRAIHALAGAIKEHGQGLSNVGAGLMAESAQALVDRLPDRLRPYYQAVIDR